MENSKYWCKGTGDIRYGYNPHNEDLKQGQKAQCRGCPECSKFKCTATVPKGLTFVGKTCNIDRPHGLDETHQYTAAEYEHGEDLGASWYGAAYYHPHGSKPPNSKSNIAWQEFRNAGMLWWVNRILHSFGWSIFIELDDESQISSVYPERSKWLGFPDGVNEECLEKFKAHIKSDDA